MPLIALKLRHCPASLISNVLSLPEVYPDPGKSRYSRVVGHVLERYLPSIFVTHRRAVPNPGSPPGFFPSPTTIGNP